MDRHLWFSRRALKLHAVILILVPAFMALCLWQVSRALGGNSLSWAYVFEWPLFACYAIYMWWRLLHEDTSDAAPDAAADAVGAENGAAPAPSVLDAAADTTTGDDPDLAAYNDYLAQLAEQDRASGHGRGH